ncbi:MAG: Type secretion system protein [Proteobacteria bacterium]|nr:Type secretion system protein [Pseudomonadota bacterium]
MKARLIQFWQSRSLREQKILAVWGVLVGTVLLVFGLILPLQQQISRLQRSIPVLEGQLFAMRAQPTPGMRPSQAASAQGDLRSTLFQLLSTRKTAADLRSLSAERVELRLPELPINEALALADGLRQDADARITTLSIKRESANGPARVVLEMERSR